MNSEGTKKKAVIYCRVSSDEQARGHSLNYQEAALKRYCENNEIEVVEIYREDYSAKTFNRPEMKRICSKYLRKKKEIDADYLFVLRWNRFTRYASDGWDYILKFRQYGIEVNAIEEHLDFNIAESKIMLAVYLSMAEVDNDKRSKSTKDGIHQALAEGRSAGHAPFGYVSKSSGKHNNWIEIDDDKAALVKEAFKRVAYGVEAPTLVYRDLRKKGMKISESSFFRMLRSIYYIGKIRVPAYGDEPEMIVDGKHKPLIDLNTFAVVQKLLKGTEKKDVNVKKIPDDVFYMRCFLRCPHCGSPIYGSFSKGRNKKYSYYHCNYCNEFRVSAETANDNMYRFLNDIKPDKGVVALYNELNAEIHNDNYRQRQDNLKEVKKRLSSIDEKMKKVQEKWLEGVLDDDTFKNMNSRLIRDKQETEMEMAQTMEKPNDKDAWKKFEYSVRFIEKMGSCISVAPIEVKLQILGSIFNGKIDLENLKTRTADFSPLVSLIVGNTDFCKGEKEKGLSDFAESPVKGGWWVSNPRPPEPQSGALAN